MTGVCVSISVLARRTGERNDSLREINGLCPTAIAVNTPFRKYRKVNIASERTAVA